MDMFPTDEAATKWFEAAIWHGTRCCGHCGSLSTSEVPNEKPMPLHDAPVGTVIAEAERSAEVTHAHPEARCGAAATALAARLAARSRDVPCPGSDPLFALVGAPLDATLRVARGLAEAQQLGPGASLEDAVAALGNGSKVSCPDTVPLALWIAFRHLDDFELAVRHALAAGGDTDTVAAIVGGVVASRVGLDGIPAAWRKRVEPVPTQLG